MKNLIALLVVSLFILGCGGGDGQAPETTEKSILPVTFTAPDAMEVPEAKAVESETDWEARVHNKNIEIIQVLNILNPIAAYITAAFEQYGDRIESATVHEEWADTQVQLTAALNLYGDCNKRIEAKKFNKKLFLDLENTWQLLVKTGVAGVRTNQMVDEALTKLAS